MTKHSPNTGEKCRHGFTKPHTVSWQRGRWICNPLISKETKPSQQERQGDKDGDKVQPPHICFCYCHTGKRGGIMSCKHCRVKPKRK